jgi:hypothetical protein
MFDAVYLTTFTHILLSDSSVLKRIPSIQPSSLVAIYINVVGFD